MATFKICVLKHQQREDGKFPVLIRIISNRTSAYLKTGLYVVKTQMSKNFDIKDNTVLRQLDKQVNEYETIILNKLAMKVTQYSAKDLRRFLAANSMDNEKIDFVVFSKEHIAKTQTPNNTAYCKKLETALNILIDFFKTDDIDIKDITARSLSSFAEYLKTERKFTRLDNQKRSVIIVKPPVSDRTVADYLAVVRTLFNAAINKFNDEDLGQVAIAHYPFRKIKIRTNHEAVNRSISIEEIRRIKNLDISEGDSRMGLARDVFMLSFYLVGMNLADIFDATDCSKGRITYNRRKTKSRRADGAYISILQQPEVVELITKYRDEPKQRIFYFHRKYANHVNFVRSVNVGLKQLSKALSLEEGLTSYYARHSWASIARNKCGVSKDDINLALNHVDKDLKITDMYLAKDWSLIDSANRKVIDLLMEE